MYRAVKYIDSHKVAVTISSLILTVNLESISDPKYIGTSIWTQILINKYRSYFIKRTVNVRYETIEYLHFSCDYIKLCEDILNNLENVI